MQSEVKTFMTGQPVAIEPEASTLAALDLMIEHGIRHLPVVDRDKRVCGVLSFDDLRAAFPMPLSLRVPPSVEERVGLPDMAVGEAMTYGPVTVLRDTALEDAAQRMADARIGCLIVVDAEGRLEGILSETDLLYALVNVLWADRRVRERTGESNLVDLLERERAHITEQLAAYERSERDIASTRRASPVDSAEVGKEVEDISLTEGLADLATKRLRGIDRALERERLGTLSTCERCGGTIREGRLRALPGTTVCIRCAHEQEAT